MPTRADHRAQKFRHAVFLQPVDIEAVVAAGHQHIAGEGHVGIGEAQQWRTLAPLGVIITLTVVVYRGGLVRIVLWHRRLHLGGVFRVEKPGRLGQRGQEFQIHDRLACVFEAGREPGAGIGRQADQQRIHALDLGGLVIGDIRRELEQYRVECRTRLLQQLLDHLHRALVVGDHQLQEQLVEGRAL